MERNALHVAALSALLSSQLSSSRKGIDTTLLILDALQRNFVVGSSCTIILGPHPPSATFVHSVSKQ